mmetsp:Transcript_20618/g.53285  ORF Transcript_20618/g.53285 Transcript_20618/m.53285 type:complete len:397 (+) Transcript_20618:251-1441(+)
MATRQARQVGLDRSTGEPACSERAAGGHVALRALHVGDAAHLARPRGGLALLARRLPRLRALRQGLLAARPSARRRAAVVVVRDDVALQPRAQRRLALGDVVQLAQALRRRHVVLAERGRVVVHAQARRRGAALQPEARDGVCGDHGRRARALPQGHPDLPLQLHRQDEGRDLGVAGSARDGAHALPQFGPRGVQPARRPPRRPHRGRLAGAEQEQEGPARQHAHHAPRRQVGLLRRVRHLDHGPGGGRAHGVEEGHRPVRAPAHGPPLHAQHRPRAHAGAARGDSGPRAQVQARERLLPGERLAQPALPAGHGRRACRRAHVPLLLCGRDRHVHGLALGRRGAPGRAARRAQRARQVRAGAAGAALALPPEPRGLHQGGAAARSAGDIRHGRAPR